MAPVRVPTLEELSLRTGKAGKVPDLVDGEDVDDEDGDEVANGDVPSTGGQRSCSFSNLSSLERRRKEEEEEEA